MVMDEFIPRLHAPQPKVLNMRPPSYTVPDVTVIGESGDSLVLRSCLNLQENKEKKILIKPRSYAGDISHKENIPVKNGPNPQTEPLNFANIDPGQRKFQNQCNVSKAANDQVHAVSRAPNVASASKVAYNPQIYMSPPAIESVTHTPTPKTFTPLRTDKRHRNSGNCFVGSPDLHNITEKQFGRTTKTMAQACKATSPIVTNVFAVPSNSGRYESPNNDRMKQSICQASPLATNTSGSPGPNVDSHMLKLFEFQNEQIRCLHKLLEKFMDKSCDDENKHCLEERCPCITNKAETYINKTTNKRSVATNTDISWGNLYSDYKQTVLKNGNCTSNDPESKRDVPAVAVKTCKRTNHPSFASATREVTKALEGIHMDTIYDDISPEPSLHLEVPEFDDNQSSDDDQDDQQYAYNAKNPANAKVSQQGRKPASILYEQHKQREFLTHGYANSPNQTKKGEKLSKAIRNLEKIIHEGDEERSEMDYMDTKDSRNNRERVGTMPEVLEPATSRIQVEEHFGVSVLDRAGHPDARQGAPVFNAFIMSRYLQGEIIPPDFGTVTGPHRDRPGSSSHIPDAQFAALAQRSPGTRMDRRVRIQSDKHSPPQTRARPKEFSIATEQFLCKYQLDG